MKKSKAILSILGLVLLSSFAISVAAAQEDFSGDWVLDKGKTHDLPPGLKGYTMVVTQTEQQLVVETKLEGDLRTPEGGPGEGPPEGKGPPGGGFPGGEPGEGGPPGGGPGAGGFPPGGPPVGTMALRMVIPKASYFLDGQESTAPLEQPMPGTAKLKAKWTKDKKGLELSSFRETNFGGNSVTFTTREKWALSDDGETLKIQRSVETPRGLDTIKLTFHKVPGKPPLPKQ
jgi:hypothetical protein